MNPFEQLMAPAMLGSRPGQNAFGNLRNMLLLQREQRYDQAPRPRSQRQPGMMNGGMPGMGGDDMSAFTYDPHMRDMARAMGVNPLAPENVNPNAVFPNHGFFGNHPTLTNALEGGLFGAANTQGANTWGEGISNVAQGFLQGRSQRQGMINRQFETPFENFGQMEKLRGLGIENNLHEAMIQHYRAQSEHMKNQDALGIDKLEATRPMSLDNGRSFLQYDSGAGQWHNTPNPFYIEKPDSNAQEWPDFKEGYLGDPKNKGKGVTDAWKEFNREKAKAAQPKGVFMAVPDGKGGQVTRYMTDGTPIPSGTQTPSDMSHGSQPTLDTKDMEAEVKAAGSADARKQIKSDIRRQRFLDNKGKKVDFLALDPTDQDIDAVVEKNRQAIRQRYNKPKDTPSPMPGGEQSKIKFIDNNRTYFIPSNMVDDFKRDHPNAR